MRFWVTSGDRALQREIAGLLKAVLVELRRPDGRAIRNGAVRPMVMSEEQLDDLSEVISAQNGRRVRFEDDE